VRVRFSTRELLDFALAWVALSLAFALFFNGGPPLVDPASFLPLLAVSFLTAGVGFLLHEMAHKLTAIHFGKLAEFRADYGMLFIAVVTALAGFLFAAPGAVYHRGRSTVRENGLIALAGPLTNVALAVPFVPLLLFDGFAGLVGIYGVRINLLLAGFNMVPFGPLDGRTVLDWNRTVFAGAFVVCVGLAVFALFGFGFPVL
jgi:Zn-dependent protease